MELQSPYTCVLTYYMLKSHLVDIYGQSAVYVNQMTFKHGLDHRYALMCRLETTHSLTPRSQIIEDTVDPSGLSEKNNLMALTICASYLAYPGSRTQAMLITCSSPACTLLSHLTQTSLGSWLIMTEISLVISMMQSM